MQAHSTHGINRYRCRFPKEYALRTEADHPRDVFLREDAVVPALDEWVAQIFDPDRIDETCASLASTPDLGRSTEVEAATRKVADCDERLARYRAALDGGADPATVAGWMREVQAERANAERIVREHRRESHDLTPDDVRELIEAVGDIGAMLAEADVPTKAQLYAALGLRLTYEPKLARVFAEAQPLGLDRVRGGT